MLDIHLLVQCSLTTITKTSINEGNHIFACQGNGVSIVNQIDQNPPSGQPKRVLLVPLVETPPVMVGLTDEG